MPRIIYVDDENLDEDGVPYQEDITEQVNELVEENEQMGEYLEEVAASFEQEQGIELSQAAEELLLARNAKPKSSGGTGGASSKGAASGGVKPKPSPGASTSGTSGVGGAWGGRVKKAVKSAKPKAASLGKHVMHAAKVVGRAAAKNKGALVAGAAAAGGAGLGYARGRYDGSVKASHDSLSLQTEDVMVEDEEELFDDDYTQEELDAMTPEQAAELLESQDFDEDELEQLEEIASEEERQTSLRDFARNVMVKDAESRHPAKK